MTWKIILGCTGLIILFNQLPTGLHYLTYDKYNAINFNKTLEFLKGDIIAKHSSGRPTIFLDGIPASRGMNFYHTFVEFVLSTGLKPSEFDLKSTTVANGPDPAGYKIEQPFTVFKIGNPPSQISRGDYLIVGPFSPNNQNGDYLQSLKKDYDLLFQTESELVLPNLTLTVVAKRAVEYIIYNKILHRKYKDMSFSQYLLKRPHLPDYYVLLHK